MKQEDISHLIEEAIILELQKIIRNKAKFNLAFVRLIELYLKYYNKKQISNEQIKKIIEDFIK